MGDPSTDSLLGATLSHFQVDARLGAGGMGVVYRAHDTRLARQVALKVLPPQLSQDAERKRLLLKEARAAAAINHPNLAAIYEVGEENGHAFIAMELVQGRSVRQLLAHGALPKELALSIAVQVAQALHRAHSAGLIHRDLKPENVMVGDDGTVKLLDFGLAKNTAVAPKPDDGARLSGEGKVLGTPGYMAPEQAAGQQVDHRADLFAFGAMLYEMLDGHPAFKGATPVELMIAAARDPAPPLQRVDLDSQVPNLVGQLLEKDPSRRPASATQVLATLGVHAPVAPPQQVDAFAPTIASPLQRHSPMAPPHPRRAIYAVAALAVAAIAFAAWWVGMRGAIKKTPHLLAVTDISNQTGEPDLDALSGMLITSLEQSRQLSVLTRARMFDLLKQLRQMKVERIDESLGRDLCARAGADALVVSSVSKLGNRYQLDVKVLAPGEDSYLFAVRDQANNKEELPAAIDRLAERTRERLTPGGEQVMSTAVATTDNMEAYRAYFEAETALQHVPDSYTSEPQLRAVLPKLERAVELDPGFVQAWNTMAWIQLFTHDEKTAAHSLEQAMKSASRATPKDKLFSVALAAQQAGDHDRAIDTLRQLVATWPSEKLAWYELGDVQFHEYRLADATAPFEKVLKLDPSFGLAYDHLGVAYADLNRVADFQALAAAYQQKIPGPSSDGMAVSALFLQGRNDEAVALLAKRDRLLHPFWLGLLLRIDRGEVPQVLAALETAQAKGPEWLKPEVQNMRAVVALSQGRPAQAAGLLTAIENDLGLTTDERARIPAREAMAWGFARDVEKTYAAAARTNETEDRTARAEAMLAIAELDDDTWLEGAKRVKPLSNRKLLIALHQLLETGGDGDPGDAAQEALRKLNAYMSFSARQDFERGRFAEAAERAKGCAERPRTGDLVSSDFVFALDRQACWYWRARALEALAGTEADEKKRLALNAEAVAIHRRLAELFKDAEPNFPLAADVASSLARLEGAGRVNNHPF